MEPTFELAAAAGERGVHDACRMPRSCAGSIVVLDRAPDHPELVDVLARAVERHARLRKRPVERPGRRREWRAQRDFDLSFHLRWESIASDRDLLRVATERHGRPFARSAPPWEVHVLAGPSRALVLLRTDPVLEEEGLAGALLERLLDADSEVRSDEGPRFPPDEPGSPAVKLLQTLDALAPRTLALRDSTLALLGAARRAAAGSSEIARTTLDAVRRESAAWPEELGAAALRTARSLGALVTERLAGNSAVAQLATTAGPRAVALVDLPLAALDAVRGPLGLALEDVVLSIASGALARLGQARGDAATRPLRARISLPEVRDATLLLPLELTDPLERAAHFRDLLADLGGRAHRATVRTVAGAMTALPLALARGMSPRTVPRYDLALSYRELPFDAGALAGARVRRVYPLAACAGATGLAVAAQRFDRRLTLGLTFDARVVGSADGLASAWRAACGELLETGIAAASRAAAEPSLRVPGH